MSKSLFDLSGKVALITGSTKGIGKSIAEELARAGCKIVVSSRKAEACEAVRAEFEKQGFEVLAQPCNISRKDELQALVDALGHKHVGVRTAAGDVFVRLSKTGKLDAATNTIAVESAAKADAKPKASK